MNHMDAGGVVVVIFMCLLLLGVFNLILNDFGFYNWLERKRGKR